MVKDLEIVALNFSSWCNHIFVDIDCFSYLCNLLTIKQRMVEICTWCFLEVAWHCTFCTWAALWARSEARAYLKIVAFQSKARECLIMLNILFLRVEERSEWDHNENRDTLLQVGGSCQANVHRVTHIYRLIFLVSLRLSAICRMLLWWKKYGLYQGKWRSFTL